MKVETRINIYAACVLILLLCAAVSSSAGSKTPQHTDTASYTLADAGSPSSNL